MLRAGLDMLGALGEETGCRALVIHHARKPTEDDPGGKFAIRGSGAIYDALDAAYIFSAPKGEPVSVANEKARSHGELVEPWALVIRDVEIDGDPRAGLSVEVRGIELVHERREAREAVVQRDEVRRDAEAVRKVLGSQPGLASGALRAAVRLSGDRFSRALGELGSAVEVPEEPTGKGPPRRAHFLRGVGPS